ncbi:beta-ketoacyl-ACP synthase [Nitratireductor sp. GISD-1A_MAKvit]|uniref:beta-ketoacyl-ACP synthase n=1 Tax=Nitratireductor sp. GISD-1A_MAKvit TaxID=3234198 RepID=UPI00346556F0
MSPRDVVITGMGIVSSLGEGADAHWQALTAKVPTPVLDRERFAPYSIHPLPEIDWGQQIPRRGDQRQMETWQRLGTYAAGLALDDAGMKGDEALCASMDMVIAAGGGERDETVDEAILAASLERNDHDILLNEKLTTELRPTLFLAQLSNLLAGNISIVHKVTGSSRTFMGEEGAGVSAIETAAARIRSGQSSHVLVGASFQTEHSDMLLAYELAGFLHREDWKPVWQRAESEGGGVVSGSGAAFLILESREHAEKRGRKAYASIGPVVSRRTRRKSEPLATGIAEMLDRLPLPQTPVLALSGASGADAATVAEREALARHDNITLRGFSSLTGHLKEAQFPFAVALAALALHHGSPYPAFDETTEPAFDGSPETVLATAIGYHCYEGMGLIKRA